MSTVSDQNVLDQESIISIVLDVGLDIVLNENKPNNVSNVFFNNSLDIPRQRRNGINTTLEQITGDDTKISNSAIKTIYDNEINKFIPIKHELSSNGEVHENQDATYQKLINIVDQTQRDLDTEISHLS